MQRQTQGKAWVGGKHLPHVSGDWVHGSEHRDRSDGPCRRVPCLRGFFAAAPPCLFWPLQPLQQLQSPFGPSVDSLCHPWFTTTNLSYRFPMFETSASALCGTIGIIIFLCMQCGLFWRYVQMFLGITYPFWLVYVWFRDSWSRGKPVLWLTYSLHPRAFTRKLSFQKHPIAPRTVSSQWPSCQP